MKPDCHDSRDGVFGHLFHEGDDSHYILQVTYRIVGKQAAAIRNNGIMFHGQKPSDMNLKSAVENEDGERKG